MADDDRKPPRRKPKDDVDPGPPNAWPAGGAPPRLADPVGRDGSDRDPGDIGD